MTTSPRRPHTGRRRNDAAREAILDSTFELLRREGTDGLTIDAIAAAAGVGRQTIYRWWPSKGSVVAEAMARRARTIVPVRDSGSFTADLAAFIRDSFAGLEDPGMLRVLRELAAGAQQDKHMSQVLQDFTAQRRAALRSLLARARDRGELSRVADLDMLVDMAYGVLWYRALISHAPLDTSAADSLAAHIAAAALRK
jgi:AcrR family transcriptional regulator